MACQTNKTVMELGIARSSRSEPVSCVSSDYHEQLIKNLIEYYLVIVTELEQKQEEQNVLITELENLLSESIAGQLSRIAAIRAMIDSYVSSANKIYFGGVQDYPDILNSAATALQNIADISESFPSISEQIAAMIAGLNDAQNLVTAVSSQKPAFQQTLAQIESQKIAVYSRVPDGENFFDIDRMAKLADMTPFLAYTLGQRSIEVFDALLNDTFFTPSSPWNIMLFDAGNVPVTWLNTAPMVFGQFYNGKYQGQGIYWNDWNIGQIKKRTKVALIKFYYKFGRPKALRELIKMIGPARPMLS